MSQSRYPLSNMQQAIFVLVALILTPLGTWAAEGFPTDRTAVGVLVSLIIAGIILFIKEYLGSPVPTTIAGVSKK